MNFQFRVKILVAYLALSGN